MRDAINKRVETMTEELFEDRETSVDETLAPAVEDVQKQGVQGMKDRFPNGIPCGRFGYKLPPDAKSLTPNEIYTWGRTHIEIQDEFDLDSQEPAFFDHRWREEVIIWLFEVGNWLLEALKVGRLQDDPVLNQYAQEVFKGKVPVKRYDEADERLYYAIAHEEVVDEEPHSVGPDDS